jgi:hypothetical protein
MLEEIEMLCKTNKIRKHSVRSQEEGETGQEGAGGTAGEEEMDEEKLCNICYYNEKDTVFVPCGHVTCSKCI